MLEKMQRNYDDERKNNAFAIADLSDKLKQRAITEENERSKRIEMQEQNKELRLLIDKLRSQVIQFFCNVLCKTLHKYFSAHNRSIISRCNMFSQKKPLI